MKLLKYCVCIATHEAFVTVLCLLSNPYSCDFDFDFNTYELLKVEQKTIKLGIRSQRENSDHTFPLMF